MEITMILKTDDPYEKQLADHFLERRAPEVPVTIEGLGFALLCTGIELVGQTPKCDAFKVYLKSR